MVHYDWQNVHHYISKNLIAILNLEELLRLTWAIHVMLTDLLRSLILCKFSDSLQMGLGT